MLSNPELPSLLYFLIWNTRLLFENTLFLQTGEISVVAGLACLATVLVLLSKRLWADRQHAGLFSLLVLTAFFGYGTAFEFIVPMLPRDLSPYGRHLLMLLTIATSLLIFAILLRRTRMKLDRPLRIMNVYLLIFVLLTGAEQLYVFSNRPARSTGHVLPASQPAPRSAPETVDPDIYCLILDAYAREDVLRDLYGFNASSFTRFLRDRGFYVADRSTANYPSTFASFLSMLEGRYIDDLLAPTLYPEDFVARMATNPTMAAFAHRGYHLKIYKSGYYYTNVSPSGVFETNQYPQTGEFTGTIIGRTILPALASVLPSAVTKSIPPRYRELFFPYEGHRDRIRFAFDAMPQASSASAPVFAFAHLFAPHAPFVFDAQGQEIEPLYCFSYIDAINIRWNRTEEEYKRAYVNQLAWLQQRVRDLVNTLLVSPSNRPRVIILASDHGPGCYFRYGDMNASHLKERFANLIAVYCQNRRYGRLRQDLSLVNLFRSIRSEYLSEDLPPLPDRNIFLAGSDFVPPLASGRSVLVDVTDRVQQVMPPR
ncbi:MAG TPA: sulfatase-like hydrolase/transferase [Candidatus Ozemobacteraceae bacterium]